MGGPSDEELLTIFVLFLFFFSGRDKGRVSPIPEIHLNLCANNSQRFPWRGRATFKACESRTRFRDTAGLILWHISVPHTTISALVPGSFINSI